MKPFNNQFATQKLRENANDPKVKLYIRNSDIRTAIMDKFMPPNRTLDKMPISDEYEYLETDLNTFYEIKEFILKNFEEGLDYDYEIESDYTLRGKDPSYGQDVNDYFGTKIDEESVTGGTATITPPTVNTPAVQDWYTTKNPDEVKDRETRSAGGKKAKIYMKDKWGWKKAPSIPNRPSEMFDYEKIFENEQINEIAVNLDLSKEQLVRLIQVVKGHLGTEIHLINSLQAALDRDVAHLKENYSKFRKETRTKTNEQQFHAAVRLAEKKISEANRILEYTAQLKSELSVIKENKNTQKLMERITMGIAKAYKKMRDLK